MHVKGWQIEWMIADNWADVFHLEQDWNRFPCCNVPAHEILDIFIRKFRWLKFPFQPPFVDAVLES
jgi:hypothetical protein